MVDRAVRGSDRGHILLDALLAVFLASFTLLAALGVVGVIVRRIANTSDRVEAQIEERSRFAGERRIDFVRE